MENIDFSSILDEKGIKQHLCQVLSAQKENFDARFNELTNLLSPQVKENISYESFIKTFVLSLITEENIQKAIFGNGIVKALVAEIESIKPEGSYLQRTVYSSDILLLLEKNGMINLKSVLCERVPNC